MAKKENQKQSDGGRKREGHETTLSNEQLAEMYRRWNPKDR